MESGDIMSKSGHSRSGDKLMAVAGLRAVKECDALLAKLEAGDSSVQLSDIPSLPSSAPAEASTVNAPPPQQARQVE